MRKFKHLVSKRKASKNIKKNVYVALSYIDYIDIDGEICFQLLSLCLVSPKSTYLHNPTISVNDPT